MGGRSFLAWSKQWDMSELLMVFNDHSDCGATGRWVPFNPVLLKEVGEGPLSNDSLIPL